jgi:asparagine synthase (glutamine-hydrolysing)
MCGIAGRFHPVALSPDVSWQAESDALLAHRGPDAAGRYADDMCELVHRRLALIDLSPTGQQPLPNEDQTVRVIFNGEIYNHRDLRRELVSLGHRFRGTSDTEVLVHLYEEHGDEMVERLRGMFAFAVYDRHRRRILLARDRFGIKPLYYAVLRDQLVFASEIKAILALAGFRPSINRQACYDYLGLGYVPEPQTGFAEIQALPMGHVLTADAEGLRAHEYYRLQARPNHKPSFAAAVDTLDEALAAAVSAQAVADVPVAALLSGGIDSSLVVAALCRATDAPPTTFNVSFPDQEYDETPFARAVSDHYRTRHHTLALDDFAVTPELTQKLLLHFDQPFADSSLIPTYFVAQAIRAQGIIGALSGDGGDEAFGGYACFWRANRFAQLMRLPTPVQQAAARAGNALAPHTRDFGRQLAKAARLAHDGRRDPAILLAGLSNYLSEEQKLELVRPGVAADLRAVYRHFNGHRAPGDAGLEELSRRLTETHFTVNLASDMLRKVDMMSMLAGVEVRVPLLDERVVELGLALPHRFKTDGRSGKLVPRALARRWLPEQVATHRKQGFRIPLDRLATPRFHAMLADLLLDSQARVRELLDPQVVGHWVGRFKQARDHSRAGVTSREGLYQRILIVLALELWLREHHLRW